MVLNFKTIQLGEQTAQYLNISGGSEEEVVFYSANGFPLGTYTEFLNQLSAKFNLTCLSPRACWPNIGMPEKQTNWELYADDLIAFIEQKYNRAITVIGHSQGATAAIIACSKRPELFKSLILIEPASVTSFLGFIIKHTPYSLKKHVQPFKSGIEKQDVWETKEAFYHHCRNHKSFKRISDKILQDYVNYGLKPIENKYKLTYSAKWEASNYTLAPLVWKYLKKINIPIQVIAGKPSLFFSQDVRDKWKRISPQSTIEVNAQYGHLFPLEAPEVCARMIY